MNQKFLQLAGLLLLLPHLAFAQMLLDEEVIPLGSEKFWDDEAEAEALKVKGARASKSSEDDELSKVSLIEQNIFKNVLAPLEALKKMELESQDPAENCPPEGIDHPAVDGAMPFKTLETQCLQSRHRSAESVYQQEVYTKPSQYIVSDKAVCDCMEKTTSGGLAKNEPAPDQDELTLQHLLANVRLKQQRLQEMNEGMILQSMLLTKDKAIAMGIMQKYALPADAETKKALEKLKSEFIKTATARLKDRSPAKLARIKEIAAQIQVPDVENIKAPSPLPAPGSCISMQDYLAYEQIPKEPEFYRDLEKMKSFNEADWNLQSLKRAFDQAAGSIGGLSGEARLEAITRVKALKARIKFLKKNPLIANLFLYRKHNNAKMDAVSAKKQQQLFELITKAIRPGASMKVYRDFQKDLSAFFSNRQVAGLVRIELNDQIVNEYEDMNGLLSSKLPMTQGALENRFKLMKKDRSQDVRSCKLPNQKANLAKCSEDFMSYCKLVDTAAAAIEKQGMNLYTPSESMDQEAGLSFNTDSAENEGFQRLSDEICKKDRVSKTDKKVSMNFEKFKAQTCAEAKASLPECAPENHEALVRRFLSEFEPAPVAGRDAQKLASSEHIFAGLLADPRKIEITREDLKKIKASSVSFADLRKKGYPASAFAPDLGKVAETLNSAPSANPANEKMSRMNYPPEEQPALAPLAPVAPVLPAHAAAATAPSEVQKEIERVEADRKGLREKIAKTEDEIERAKKGDGREIADLEKRLADLTELMARRDAEFKALMEKRDQERTEAPSAVAAGAKGKKKSQAVDEEEEEETIMAAKATGSTRGGEDSFGGRFPAGLPSQMAQNQATGSTTGQAFGGSRGAAGKVSSGNLLNNALLEKYGITVSGPVEGQYLLAQEREDKKLQKLTANQDGADFSIKVTPAEYEKARAHDLAVLRGLYEQKVKDRSSSVVKLSLKTEAGGEPVVVFAIRVGDKVIFQPMRTHKLDNLKEVLNHKTKT